MDMINIFFVVVDSKCRYCPIWGEKKNKEKNRVLAVIDDKCRRF